MNFFKGENCKQHDVDVPVLLDFFTERNDESIAMHPVLRDVAAALGNKAKVIKIDVDKNKEACEGIFRDYSLVKFTGKPQILARLYFLIGPET